MNERKSDLYLVATPIGNLEDISARALRILSEVDVIACEDTKHSKRLLDRYSIAKPTVSYYKQKEQRGSEEIIAMLTEGKKVALITDAGTPCISDPGAVIAVKARSAGFSVECIPGASAITTAAALLGLGAFTFLGFLGDKNKERREKLAPYRELPSPIMIYSAPHDLDSDIAFLYDELGDRNLSVLAELTKLHERVELTTLAKGYSGLRQGEFVLVVDGKKKTDELSSLSVLEHLKTLVELGSSKKEAVKEVAAVRKLSKSEVYRVSLQLPSYESDENSDN